MIDRKVLELLDLKPNSYRKINNCVVVSDKKKTYVIKKTKKEKKELFDYLKSRSFNYMPEYINLEDYEISDYISNYRVDEQTKAVDLINIVSMLHLKTTNYKSIDLDDMKKIYEELDSKIEYLMNYYEDLNEIIDNEIYMSPSFYLLIRNISKIYSALEYAKNELDDFYENIKDIDKIRVVTLHNNLDLDHIIVGSSKYLISWDKAKVDMPIYDIYNFYKKYYRELDFDVLFEMYEGRYPLLDYEKKLFFIMISIPEKIEFSNNEEENSTKVDEILLFLSKSDRLISPYYSENK